MLSTNPSSAQFVFQTFPNYHRIRDLKTKSSIRKKEDEMLRSIDRRYLLIFKYIETSIENLFEDLGLRNIELKGFSTDLKTATIMVVSNLKDQSLLETKIVEYLDQISFRSDLDTREFYLENSLLKECPVLGYDPNTFKGEQIYRISIRTMGKRIIITFEDLKVIIETYTFPELQKKKTPFDVLIPNPSLISKSLFYTKSARFKLTPQTLETESFQNSGLKNYAFSDSPSKLETSVSQLNQWTLNVLSEEESFRSDSLLEIQYISSKIIEDEPCPEFLQYDLPDHECKLSDVSFIKEFLCEGTFDFTSNEESDLIFFEKKQEHSIQEDYQTKRKPQNEFNTKLNHQMPTSNQDLTKLDTCLNFSQHGFDLENMLIESD